MADTSTITSTDLAKAATAAPAQAPPSPDASASAPAPSPEAPAETEPKGEPPPERWPAILENARKKTRAEVEAEYAYAKGIDREEFEATRRFLDTGRQNPYLAADQLLNGLLKADPQNAKATLRRYFGHLFVDEPAAAADADPMPQPDIPTDQSNGRPVVYSNDRMLELLAWQERKTEAKIQKTLGPILSEREKAEQDAQATAYSRTAVGAIADKPGFTEHKAEIARVYSLMPMDGRTEGEKLRDAYLTVVGPKMTAQAHASVVADLTRKAEASTINPGAASASEPFDHRTASWEDSLRHEWNKRKSR